MSSGHGARSSALERGKRTFHDIYTTASVALSKKKKRVNTTGDINTDFKKVTFSEQNHGLIEYGIISIM